jgi:hypothetical protein
MRLARQYADPANAQRVADLPLREALALLREPTADKLRRIWSQPPDVDAMVEAIAGQLKMCVVRLDEPRRVVFSRRLITLLYEGTVDDGGERPTQGFPTHALLHELALRSNEGDEDALNVVLMCERLILSLRQRLPRVA